MKSFFYTLLGVGLMLGMLTTPSPVLSAGTAAEAKPEFYDRFTTHGRIDSINPHLGRVTINKELFLFDSGTLVFTDPGVSGTLSMLKEGKQIAVNATPKLAQGYRRIIEVLILPAI